MDYLQAGQQIGPYQVIHQVGRGGMATVYKAFHPAMNRYVALKVLPSQLASSPEFSKRFQQEAQLLANLEHPHILPVYDFGESDGLPYLVMRYLEGGTLKDRMDGVSLSITEIDRWFTELAEGLEYAHTRGVIHRDIKPSNAMLDNRGSLFLTDFGIARLLEGGVKLTNTGAMIGTPDYMSPEQAQGIKVDKRSDIYSLGIILYEMVTGRVPFEAETPLAVVLMHISAPMPPPTSIRPDLAPEIEQVLLKALARDPEDRFASVADFLAAWKTALQEATIPSGQAIPPAWPRPQETPSSRSTATGQIAPQLPLHGQVTQAPAGQRTAAPTITPQFLPRAASRGLPRWLVPAGLVGLVLIAALALTLVLILPRFLTRARTAAQSTRLAGIETSPTQSSLGASGAAQPGMTSWVGFNHTWQVIERDGKIITGGMGLTVWKPDNSPMGASVVQRFSGPQDGMPEVDITALLADDQGNLWVGTGGGLGRYDGSKWTLYTNQDGLDSDSIGSLALTRDGLLIGTEYCGVDGCGLQFLGEDGIKLVSGFPSVPEPLEPGQVAYNIRALLVETNGVLWVGTSFGLARLEGETWRLFHTQDGLPDNFINTLALDPDGILWVGTNSGAARWNGDTFEAVEPLNGFPLNGILWDEKDHVWFSGEGGLVRFDPDTQDWQRYSQENGLESYSFYHALAASDGSLFFGSDFGLVVYDGKDFKTWIHKDAPILGRYGYILPDPGGKALWFVGENGSPYADRLDPAQQTWSPVNILPDYCSALGVDFVGSVWCAGSAEDGISIVHPDGSVTGAKAAEGLPSASVWFVAFDPSKPGGAWLGTDGQGVAWFDGKQVAEVYNSAGAGLPSDNIRALLLAKDGTLWAGMHGGLSRRKPDGQWQHFTPGSPPFSADLSSISDIAQASDGSVWVATESEGSGLYRFADEEWQRMDLDQLDEVLNGNAIQCITAGPDGSIWVGSYYHGAAHYDGSKWTGYQMGDGLVHPNIRDIYVDAMGTVWFATSSGITRFVP